jgi:putative transposase
MMYHDLGAHVSTSGGRICRLAAPPAKGEMKAAITALAGRAWQHPTTGDPIQFGFTTIERWYYRALKERADPVGVVRRKPSLP